jgi:hypothetical protein
MSTSPSSQHPAISRPAVVDLGLALGLGGLAYALSCVVVPPEGVVKGFGEQWQMMSAAPLELRGLLPQRLLAPLLAWLCGCGGDGYVVFARGLAVFLLVTVACFALRRGVAIVDAALVTLAVAATASIQLYKEHWVGYPDPLCYALLFWMLLLARHPVSFWGLFLLNLLNHELVAFVLPWLWFVRRQAGGKWQHDVLGAGVSLGIYGAFYLWVQQHAPQQVFDAAYFANHPLFPGGSIVVWMLALVHLVVAFGPVLAVLAWHQHRRARDGERWHLWLMALSAFVIFCIAFDWARHSNLIVVPLVIASLAFLRAGHRVAYAGLIALGVVLMLWVRPWSPTAWPTHAVAAVELLVQSGVAVVGPPRYSGDLNVTFGPVSAALQNWLPVVWTTLAAIYAIGVAIWLVGALFARAEAKRA